jgi:Tfp pilus assembly protein PilV
MEKIKNNEGFTLLEVIFAISILTVGILSVAAMQAGSIRGNAFAWATSEASTVAMGQIETLLDLDYDDASLTDGSHPDVASPVTVGRYNITWTVATDNIVPRTKLITLRVSWTDHGAKSLSIPFVLGQKI